MLFAAWYGLIISYLYMFILLLENLLWKKTRRVADHIMQRGTVIDCSPIVNTYKKWVLTSVKWLVQ